MVQITEQPLLLPNTLIYSVVVITLRDVWSQTIPERTFVSYRFPKRQYNCLSHALLAECKCPLQPGKAITAVHTSPSCGVAPALHSSCIPVSNILHLRILSFLTRGVAKCSKFGTSRRYTSNRERTDLNSATTKDGLNSKLALVVWSERLFLAVSYTQDICCSRRRTCTYPDCNMTPSLSNIDSTLQTCDMW